MNWVSFGLGWICACLFMALLVIVGGKQREARLDEHQQIWQLVSPILAWDSEESIRASWLKRLLEVRIESLKKGETTND